jgi:hypothetical protein
MHRPWAIPYPEVMNQEDPMTKPPTPDHLNTQNLIPALILIGIGALSLLATLGWLGSLGGLVGTVIFGTLAYLALQQHRRSRNIWWHAAIYPLAGLAISGITPQPLAGATFLIGMGLGFLVIYRDRSARWWAIIPAGAFLSLALPTLINDGETGGALFLFGLAATFYTLTQLPQHPQRWGIYPAAVLAIIALLALTSGSSWIIPILLIAAGGWMLLKPEEAKRLREQALERIRRAATITPVTPSPAETAETPPRSAPTDTSPPSDADQIPPSDDPRPPS